MKTNWYEHRLTKPGYGQFPYIIFKVGYALFMQIPIHFLKPGQEIDLQKHPGTQVRDVPEEQLNGSREALIFLQHERILEAAEYVIQKAAIQSKKELKACLVLGKNQALYYKDGTFTRNTAIPGGGTLLDQMNQVIAMNSVHYLVEGGNG